MLCVHDSRAYACWALLEPFGTPRLIIGFHHVGLATQDLDRLAGCYVTLFGGQVLTEFSWGRDDVALSKRLGLQHSSGRLVMIGFAQARLEIFEFSPPNVPRPEAPRSVAKPGLSPICFQVYDCQKEYQRLIAAEMPFHATPLVMPSGGVFADGRDPDGNVVEIFQPPVRSDAP